MDPQVYRVIDIVIEELTSEDKLTAEKLTYVIGLLRGTLISFTKPEQLNGEDHLEKHNTLLDVPSIRRKLGEIAEKFLP